MKAYAVVVTVVALSMTLASISYPSMAKEALTCKPTQALLAPDNYPGAENIESSNNLRRKTGMAEIATGAAVYVSGRVLDANCVPLSDAVVELWQADAGGHYAYPINNRSNNYDDAFAGSGKTVTDNLGFFRFITVMPGRFGNNPPLLHLRVSYTDMNPLETLVYLAPGGKPEMTAKITPAGNTYAEYNIVMKQADPYRGF